MLHVILGAHLLQTKNPFPLSSQKWSSMASITPLSTFMLLLMLTSLPLSHSSRALALGFQEGTAMAKQNMPMQDIEAMRAESNGDWRSEDEESARQVPTGPDPLHHNQNPITP